MRTDAIDETRGFRITGRIVLFGMIAFFGTIAAMNAVMIWLAVSSHTGVVSTSSYRAGNGYQREIDEAGAQGARGWSVDAVVDRSGPEAVVEVAVRDRDRAPVTGLAVTALLRSPVGEAADIRAALVETETGLYRGRLNSLPAGNWTLLIDAEMAGERVFHSQNRIYAR